MDVSRERLEHVFQIAAGANLLIALGVIAMAVGIWRIYRASSPWAAILCGALSAVVLAGWACGIEGPGGVAASSLESNTGSSNHGWTTGRGHSRIISVLGHDNTRAPCSENQST